jgi:hypothetical protein
MMLDSSALLSPGRDADEYACASRWIFVLKKRGGFVGNFDMGISCCEVKIAS